MTVLVKYLPTLAFLAGSALAAPGGLRCRNETVWPESISDLVHDSTWPNFTALTTRWSTYEAPTFDTLFLPQTIEDLSEGLEYLSTTDKQWLAQSGGHGYSPTLGIVQNGVLINMNNFRYARANEDGTATVGSGARFRDLVSAVGNAGREVTVGNCPCVGAMGATLGGGLGRLSGLHGTSSDNLLSARVVLWNGTIVEASADSHSELFWGLRGAGQNFGIVVEATFQTYPATNGGMHYSSDMIFDRSNLSAVIEITNELLAAPDGGLDRRLAIMFTIAYDVQADHPIILLNMVYAGPIEEAQAYSGLYRPLSQVFTEQMVPWTGLASVALFGSVEAGCVTGSPINQRALMMRNLQHDTFMELVDSYSEFVSSNPLANTSAILVETFPQQGVEALPDDFSAFPHRGAFHNAVALSMGYIDEVANIPGDEWAREWRNRLADPAVSGYDTLHVYQNYAHDDEPLSAIYGDAEWRHERLTALKEAYDPEGRFNAYHAIPNILEDWS